MSYSVEITNAEVYYEKVNKVELDFHKGGMNGDVAIEVEGKGEICFTGEHGSHDYQEDYGFIIVEEIEPTYEEIEPTEEAIEIAKKEGYDWLLQVDEVLFALNHSEFEEAANIIAQECGYTGHDHDSDIFFGCSVDESELVVKK